MMDEFPPEIAANPDADKPLEERIVSKNWLARQEAFKEINNLFQNAPINCANDSFKDYASKW